MPRPVRPWIDRLLFAAVRHPVVAVLRAYWRVRVHGRHHVPRTGACIVAPVHRSNVDFAVAAMTTRRRLRFLSKHTVWSVPVLGPVIGALGAIPVERGTADRAAMRAVEDVLRAGEPVVVFPEGTRQTGERLGPLFDGVAYLAQRTGAPIVPVGIAGSELAMPKGSRLIRPAQVVVVVGSAIPPVPTDDGRKSRRAVRELTAELTVGLQAAFDEARRIRSGHPGGA